MLMVVFHIRVLSFLKLPHQDAKTAASLGPSLKCTLAQRSEREALISPDEEDENVGRTSLTTS